MIENDKNDNIEYLNKSFNDEFMHLNGISNMGVCYNLDTIEEVIDSEIHNNYNNIIDDTIKNFQMDESKEVSDNIIKARKFVLNNSREKAFNEYSNILKTDDKNIEALYFTANYYKSLGDNEHALSFFRKLIDMKIKNTSVYENIAMLDNEKSHEYFLNALGIYYNTGINCYHIKKIVYIILDRYKNADYEIAYKYSLLAVEIADNDFLYNLMGCVCYKMQYYDEALSSFYNAIDIESNLNANVLCNIAYCYNQKGSKKLSDRYLKKTWKYADKNNKQLLFAIAKCYMNNENYILSEIFLKKVLDMDSNFIKAKTMLEKINAYKEK